MEWLEAILKIPISSRTILNHSQSPPSWRSYTSLWLLDFLPFSFAVKRKIFEYIHVTFFSFIFRFSFLYFFPSSFTRFPSSTSLIILAQQWRFMVCWMFVFYGSLICIDGTVHIWNIFLVMLFFFRIEMFYKQKLCLLLLLVFWGWSKLMLNH